ncbi:hypothetical protein ACMXYQ_04505 [Neptuniibacter sp. PT34_22]|uniref:hypothetical protein n=1 Tax=Neptuniibacter sp. PT34_22 TaxID=3398205 RepID=UPI0039F54ABD
MKIALSTQQIAPVYPSKPVHAENRHISIPEKIENTESKAVLLKAHQVTQEKELVKIYRHVTERASAMHNGEAKLSELEIYQYDGRRELNIKHHSAAHSLHITV